MKRQQEATQERKIQTSNEDQKKLTRLVTACYEGLNTYGKSPEQLEASIMLMQMTLGRFQYDTVREAFSIYLQTGSTMPTPADIIKIIEPPIPEKKWCKITFLEIRRKKRENVFVSLDEERYLNDFIRAEVNSTPDERAAISEAVKQAQIEDKQYWIE